MALATDLAALKFSLKCWEIFEYSAAAIVFLGVLGEYVAEFTRWATGRPIEKKLAKLSTLVLIAGVAGEGLGLFKTNQLSGQLVASLEERLKHRHLMPEQRTELIRRLKLSSKGRALMTCAISDGEACDFLHEISDALTESGWTAVPDIPRVFPVNPVGIELSIRRRDAPNAPLEALDPALEAVGLKISKRGVLPELSESFNVRILVGSNPAATK